MLIYSRVCRIHALLYCVVCLFFSSDFHILQRKTDKLFIDVVSQFLFFLQNVEKFVELY